MVFSQERIKDLDQVMTLTVSFNPLPTACPQKGCTLDWAYVWDRNEDGVIDYIAYLDSARPVKGRDFPADFPIGTRLKKEHLYLIIDSGRMTFTHFADDNFDGRTDTIVAVLPDPARPFWVEEFGVLRSTGFDGKVDETWTFKERIEARTGTVPRSEGGYAMINLAPNKNVRDGGAWLEMGTAVLRVIHEGTRQGKLGHNTFPSK